MTTKVDKYGFAIRECRRCGGSGRYSYNTIDGDRCYGCGGTGWQHTPKASKAYLAWVAACKAARQPVGADLLPGDLVRDYHAPKSEPFAKVVAVAHDPYEWAGHSNRPDGTRFNIMTGVTIILDDGRIWRHRACSLVRRKRNVPAAPFLAWPGATM